MARAVAAVPRIVKKLKPGSSFLTRRAPWGGDVDGAGTGPLQLAERCRPKVAKIHKRAIHPLGYDTPRGDMACCLIGACLSGRRVHTPCRS